MKPGPVQSFSGRKEHLDGLMHMEILTAMEEWDASVPYPEIGYEP